jgi:hypothetical protein
MRGEYGAKADVWGKRRGCRPASSSREGLEGAAHREREPSSFVAGIWIKWVAEVNADRADRGVILESAAGALLDVVKLKALVPEPHVSDVEERMGADRVKE